MLNCRFAPGINSAMQSAEATSKEASNCISHIVLSAKRCCVSRRPKPTWRVTAPHTALQIHVQLCLLGQNTRHLAATSGPIPVKSIKSFMLAIENANCSIICRERSSIYTYVYVCVCVCMCFTLSLDTITRKLQSSLGLPLCLYL